MTDLASNSKSSQVEQKEKTKTTQQYTINQGASENKDLLEYEKSSLWKFVRKLKRLDREVGELETTQ